MAGIQIEVQPFCEPVSLAEMKNWLRVSSSDDDDDISDLITAAREYCEMFTRRSFINKGYVQVLDAFPYFADAAYSTLAYPPHWYSLARYSTTAWNYSQQIKLFFSRVAPDGGSPITPSVTIDYIDAHAAPQTLTGTTDPTNTTADFWADVVSEPARLFPPAGKYWPPAYYHGNAVRIHFVAGYNDDGAIAAARATYAAGSPIPSKAACDAYEASLRRADVPRAIRLAIRHLVAHWYDNRPAVMADALKEAPLGVKALLYAYKIMDVAPTRG